MQDYFFVEQGYNYSEILDILNIQLATVFTERLSIEDELRMIEIFGDEDYRVFSEKLDDLAKNEAAENAEKAGFDPEEIRLALLATA